MAETVQKRLETMTEELLELQRIKLFTKEELWSIVKKRREFESKIHSDDVKLLTDYINYEKLLLRTIKLRRDKKKIHEKRGAIEHAIIKRIKGLYESGMQNQLGAIALFQSFLKFCKQVKYTNAALNIIERAMKIHSNRPEIWHISAKWHAYERNDVNNAMILLLKGVAIHKDSQLLYKEMIEVELFANKSKMNESSMIQTVCLDKLEKIINTIFETISDHVFYIEVLESLEKYEATVKIQQMVVDFLLEGHSQKEHVWHALAQRERRVLYNISLSESESADGSTSESTQNKNRTPRARLEACFAKYREGLSKVGPTNKPNLWLLFIDFLLELQQDAHGAATVLKMETLKAALNDASKEKCLSERHYMSWIELSNEQDALQIAENGTSVIPTSVELWKARLRLQIIINDSSKVDQVFKLGIAALKENALPLWSSIIRYHYLTSSDELIELIYKDGVKQVQEISTLLKPQYIQWLVLSKGIEAAREVYFKLAIEKPYCKELHEEMSKLESIEIDHNYNSWEKVHKLATWQFGDDDVDVWINYIQFYLFYNNKIPNVNECVQRIYKEAEEKLPKVLLLDFITKYKKTSELV